MRRSRFYKICSYFLVSFDNMISKKFPYNVPQLGKSWFVIIIFRNFDSQRSSPLGEVIFNPLQILISFSQVKVLLSQKGGCTAKNIFRFFTDLDTIFKNHEIFNNLDIKSLTQIPKETFLYDEIEKIWHDIDNNDDWSLFNKKIDSINIFKQANINHGLG